MGEGNREPGISRRYAPDKPQECRFCYFWDSSRKRCRQKACWYLLTSEKDRPGKDRRGSRQDDAGEGNCSGCPYGRHYPCIGYCMKNLMEEMKLKKQGSSGKEDGRDAG